MKIQVLELPTEYVGEYGRTPYAVIISEVPEEDLDSLGEATNALMESDGGPVWTFSTTNEVEL